MALYLGVTRSQWSMYTIGKRKLPITAMEKLAKLLQHLQVISTKKQKANCVEKNQKITESKLKNKLAKMELQKNIYVKKRFVFEKKQQELFASSISLFFLQNEKGTKKLSQQIENRMNKEMQTYNETNWLLLNEKINALENELKSLKLALKKLYKT
jgi:hypothetical protein